MDQNENSTSDFLLKFRFKGFKWAWWGVFRRISRLTCKQLNRCWSGYVLLTSTDVDDGGGRYLSFNMSVRYQHQKDVIKSFILSPTSNKCQWFVTSFFQHNFGLAKSQMVIFAFGHAGYESFSWPQLIPGWSIMTGNDTRTFQTRAYLKFLIKIANFGKWSSFM